MREATIIDVEPDVRSTPPKGVRQKKSEPNFPKWLLIVPALALLVAGWVAFANSYTEWLWYQSLGFAPVFSIGWATSLALGAGVAAAAFAFLYLNFRYALNRTPEPSAATRFVEIEGQRVEMPNVARLVRPLALLAAAAFSIFLGMIAAGQWDTVLRYLYGVPFGAADPVFNRDVSFYVFTLPVLELVTFILYALVVISLVGAAVIYYTRSAESFDGKLRSQTHFPSVARKHLLLLGAFFALLLAWSAYLAKPNLIFSPGGAVAGASYTDIAASLPVLWVQMIVALLLAGVAILSIFRNDARLLVAAIGLYLIVTFAGGWLYPSFVQRFSVAPNELAKETPFIEHNIAATRAAWGLDGVEEREIGGDQVLTAEDINENRRTVNNIRLWDQQPLLDTFAQIQEIRTYYEFNSVDNDRYRLGGELQQVMLSPRELNSETLPNRNWINEHLTFTHGYGATVGPVDKVTPEGMPQLFVQDIPPRSSVPELQITRPEIYFGELTNTHVFTGTRTQEFSHPAGEENVFRNYTGADGVHVGSLWRQLLYATRFGDTKLLLSNDFTPESRVLYKRNIRERLQKVAPYLRFDSDPYMVVQQGRLFWIADAYTQTSRYPFSQPVGGVNYMRNSVKAVVDAYDGSVRLYVADSSDPIIKTYANIYPGTLLPISEMPESLRAHLRYPEDIFRLQTQVYATYHMDSPQAIYNKEDQWAVASVPDGNRRGESSPMEPYYTIMKLPGEAQEEFILMLPFTPQRKDNLASWMVARSDGDAYGRMVVYRFPKQKLIFGPKQVMARINQDPEISRQLSLWNQRGSQVILGTLMVIPVEESLIYVQPLYLRAEQGRIPELRRVIVAADNRIAMEPTLEASLARIFGGAGGTATAASTPNAPEQTTAGVGTAVATPTAPPPAATGTLAEQARTHYEGAMEAQRAGDWARYGEEIKRLGVVLEQMNQGGR